jgi:membrane-associated protein
MAAEALFMVIYDHMFGVQHIIESGGLFLIGFIIFAETGLLLGFFLPGDTLLFTAGFFAAQGRLPLAGLLAVVIVSAIVGNEVGYEIGARSGKRIFSKKDGLLFREEYIVRAEKFYEKHGGKTIIMARFVPIVRTFSSVVAGVGNMPRRKFFIYNVIGALLWCATVVLLGHWLGSKIPNIDKYLLPVVGLAMLVTVGPTIFHVLREVIKRKLQSAKVETPEETKTVTTSNKK